MSSKKYVKRVLRELDKDLKRLSREDKLGLLRVYKYSLEVSLNYNYPSKFSAPVPSLIGKYRESYKQGTQVGNQFGPLELELARELLAEVEKRKQKFSQPSLLKQFYDMFGRVWTGK